MKILKILINNLFSKFNLKLLSLDNFDKLLSEKKQLSIEKDRLQATNQLIQVIKPLLLDQFIKNTYYSKSQLAQDLFVMSELNFKKNGFFVEFGSTDGIDLSNSFLLEKKFFWKGILAEPAKEWHKDLIQNRDVFIEKNCVWHSSNKILTFNEVGVLSTIDSFSNLDIHAETRVEGKKYKVKTISLEDLLDKYNAPKIIDYLSIDTEGSEYDILSSFNFEKYKFRVITCEHNFTSNREKIFNLLSDKGYERKYSKISKFDDWYVLKV